MLSKLRFSPRKQEGVTATEYALIIAVVALVMVAGATVLGTSLSTLFSSIGTSV
jgi:pilus assembly protein Flp/PilA